MNPVVEMENVVKYYDQKRPVGLFRRETHRVYALNGVSFSLEKGDLCAYAGPNGAGKSTTFKLLSGMLSPQAGKVSAFGGNPAERRVAMMQKTGVLFGNRSELWWDHPVRTSFLWKKQVWGIDDRAYAENLGFLKELLDLEEVWTVFARELSLGQRMRANLALTFLHDPQLVLLDEPTLGLDVLAKRQMIGFIKRINEEKKATILVTSHDMDDLMEMTRRVILIQRGKLAFDGDLQALLFRTGDRRTLRITRPGPAPELPGAKLVSSAQGVHAYEFIGTETWKPPRWRCWPEFRRWRRCRMWSWAVRPSKASSPRCMKNGRGNSRRKHAGQFQTLAAFSDQRPSGFFISAAISSGAAARREEPMPSAGHGPPAADALGIQRHQAGSRGG